MPSRLRLPYIEQKPKTVLVASTWRDPAGLLKDPAIAETLKYIRTCIQNGPPLPTGYYSKQAGATRDELLETHGVMHLHLGKPNTDELLWLVQYPTHVVLLELSDHRPFASRPPGTRLHGFHSQGLVTIEQTIDAELVQRQVRIRVGLLKRGKRKPKEPLSR